LVGANKVYHVPHARIGDLNHRAYGSVCLCRCVIVVPCCGVWWWWWIRRYQNRSICSTASMVLWEVSRVRWGGGVLFFVRGTRKQEV